METLLRTNSNRRFRFEGKTYYVGNITTKPTKKGEPKYLLYEILPDDKWVLQYDWFYELLKFKAIRDAQRYVRDWSFTLRSL